jgi:hypothetical protein
MRHKTGRGSSKAIDVFEKVCLNIMKAGLRQNRLTAKFYKELMRREKKTTLLNPHS